MGPDRPQYHLVQGRRRSGCTTKALELAAWLEQLHQRRFALLVPTEAERDRLRASGRTDVWCIVDDYPSRQTYVVDNAHQMRQVDLVRVRATGADLILVTHPAASELWQLLFADYSEYIFLHSPRKLRCAPAGLAVEQAAANLVRQCEEAAGGAPAQHEAPAEQRVPRPVGGSAVPSAAARGPAPLLVLLVFVIFAVAMVARAAWQIRLWDSNRGAL